MTSNQTQARAVAESIRHDQAVESETIRYNNVLERLETSKQSLTSRQLDIDEYYKTEDIRLRREYNDWYMQYMTANEAKKREIESQGTAIQQQLADIEKWYKEQSASVAAGNLDVERERNAEINRHNQEMESFNFKTNQITEDWNTFMKRMNEYDRELHYLDYTLDKGKLDLDREKFEYEKGIEGVDAASNAVFRILNGAAQAVSTFLLLRGAGVDPKTAARAFFK